LSDFSCSFWTCFSRFLSCTASEWTILLKPLRSPSCLLGDFLLGLIKDVVVVVVGGSGVLAHSEAVTVRELDRDFLLGLIRDVVVVVVGGSGVVGHSEAVTVRELDRRDLDLNKEGLLDAEVEGVDREEGMILV
jgi:hypothetical protein